MKKKRFLWVIPAIAMMLSLAALPVGAAAAEASAAATPVTAGDTVKIPLFTEPRSLTLPHNTASCWFMIPNGSKLGDGSTLSLQMKVTGTLLDDYSNVTLLINNVQISSTPIMKVVRGGGTWTVPVPTERLKTDGTLNELSIVTAQRSILGDCADIDNPSNWVTLGKDSALNLHVLQTGDPDLGTVFPYFFNRADQANRIDAEFVLPSDAEDGARAAMLTAASAAGAEYSAKDNVSFTVSQGNSAGEEQNRIYIGLGSHRPQGIPTVPALNAGDGYLAVAKNGGHSDFCMFGADAAGLAKAAAFLTNAKYLSQLSGSSSVISTDLRNKSEAKFAPKEDGYYSLSDFGYDTANLAGAFHQEVTYALKQPKAMRSGSDSYVEIHFRHSTALVADTSLLTVYVDNVAVSSIQLSDSNAAGGTIKAKIPAGALENGTINIKIDCYNYLGKIDCSKDYYDTAWTVVDKDSVVYFEPGNSGLRPTVQKFPSFDAQTADRAATAILSLPRNASASLMGTAAELACRAGQNSGVACKWEYTDALSDAADKASSDILIMGTNDNVSIPDEIAAQLDVVPRGGNHFTVSGSASVTAEALQNKIVVQAVRSPWNFSRTVYVVTCPSSMESQLKGFVADRNNLDKLSGSMALIDEKGTVTSVSGAAAGSVDRMPLTADRILGQIVRATGIPRAGLFIILACILIIILLMIKVLTNRRRFANAKKKMEKINENSGERDTGSPSSKIQLFPEDKGKDAAESDDFDHDKDDR